MHRSEFGIAIHDAAIEMSVLLMDLFSPVPRDKKAPEVYQCVDPSVANSKLR
jgi:hypothetical protein